MAGSGAEAERIGAYRLGWAECFEWMMGSFPHMDTLHPSWFLESRRAMLGSVYRHWPEAFEDDSCGESDADCTD